MTSCLEKSLRQITKDYPTTAHNSSHGKPPRLAFGTYVYIYNYIACMVMIDISIYLFIIYLFPMYIHI